MPGPGDPSWESEKAAAIERLENLRKTVWELEELTAEKREAYEEAIRVAEPYIRLGGLMTVTLLGPNDLEPILEGVRHLGPFGYVEPYSDHREVAPRAAAFEPHGRTGPELLRDWAAVMRELRSLGIIRTNNNPVGDVAEAIVAEYYRGKRGGFAQAGWDVKTPAGERIQVKAMRQVAGGERRTLSPIRDADYDFVVIVILDEDFVVTEGLRLSRELVEELFPPKPYVNGRVIAVTQALREHQGVERLDLHSAAARVGSGRQAPSSASEE